VANTEQPSGSRRLLAFEEFRRLHRDRLYRAVTSVTGEPGTAIEAVDKAMARAAERWDVVVDHTGPAGWVFRNALRRGRLPVRRVEKRLGSALRRVERSLDDPS
jgi:DNA-directed RNA polymerase specialized sigma24 family protein